MHPMSNQPLMTHCPLCRALYADEQVKLVLERSQARLYHSMCGTCRHGLFAYVLEAQGGISSIGLVTDASGEDAMSLADAPTVTSEECIAAHRMLSEQSKDICRRLLDISGKLA